MSQKSKAIITILLIVILLAIGGLYFAWQKGLIFSSADELNNENSYNSTDSNIIYVQIPADISENEIANISSKSLSDLSTTEKISKDKIDQAINAIVAQKIEVMKKTEATLPKPSADDAEKIEDNKQTFKDYIIILVDEKNQIITSTTNNRVGIKQLTFSYGDSIKSKLTSNQFTQLQNITNRIYNEFYKIFGDPPYSGNVNFKHIEGSYSCNTTIGIPEINLGCIEIKPDVNIELNRRWIEIIAHELTHAYQNQYIFAWQEWSEGVAATIDQIIPNRILDNENIPSFFDTEAENENINTYTSYNRISGSWYNNSPTSWGKLFREDQDIFKKINQKYYQLMNSQNLPRNILSRVGLQSSALLNSISQVEGLPIDEWYAKQAALHPRNETIKADIAVPPWAWGQIQFITDDPSKEYKMKIFDYQNKLLGEKKFNESVFGQLSEFQNFPIDISQRLRITLEGGNKIIEKYSMYAKPYGSLKGFYGIVTGIDEGMITIKSLSDSSKTPTQTEIRNGAFNAGEATQMADRYELSVTNKEKSRICTRIINKGNINYYAFLSCPDPNQYKFVANAIAQKRVRDNNAIRNISYQLPDNFINFTTIYSKNASDYQESSIQNNNFGDFNFTLKTGADYENKVWVFATDGYLILPSETPTPITDPNTSTITTDLENVIIDNSQRAKITVKLKDMNEVPVTQRKVEMRSNRQQGWDQITQPAELTNSNGEAKGFVNSQKYGDAYISAYDMTDPANPIRLTKDVRVNFAYPGKPIQLFAKDNVNPGVNFLSFPYKYGTIKIYGLDKNKDSIVHWDGKNWEGLNLDNLAQEIRVPYAYYVNVTENKKIWVDGEYNKSVELPLNSLNRDRGNLSGTQIGTPFNEKTLFKDVKLQYEKKTTVCRYRWRGWRFYRDCYPETKTVVKSLPEAAKDQVIVNMSYYDPAKQEWKFIDVTKGNNYFAPYRGYYLQAKQKATIIFKYNPPRR